MMVAAAIGILGITMFYLVDTGALEKDLGELTTLRAAAVADKIEWLGGQVAWLKMSGTHIDYPVMQAGDNRWYLTHDFLNREDGAGAVFLDYRNDSFNDNIAIVYGHRMNGDLMFSDVAKYRDENYLSDHKSGVLKLRNGETVMLLAIEFRQISADDDLYKELKIGGHNNVIILSTCDRARHEMRDVLILEKK
jgi:hypothetical protein